MRSQLTGEKKQGHIPELNATSLARAGLVNEAHASHGGDRRGGFARERVRLGLKGVQIHVLVRAHVFHPSCG